MLSKQNYVKCEEQQFIKLWKCHNMLSSLHIDRMIQNIHQIGNINIFTHQIKHKYYRAEDKIKNKVYYSAE